MTRPVGRPPAWIEESLSRSAPFAELARLRAARPERPNDYRGYPRAIAAPQLPLATRHAHHHPVGHLQYHHCRPSLPRSDPDTEAVAIVGSAIGTALDADCDVTLLAFVDEMNVGEA